MPSLISIMVSHFDCKHSCLVEKNVPIAFILPSRWQDGESRERDHQLSMLHDSKICPWHRLWVNIKRENVNPFHWKVERVLSISGINRDTPSVFLALSLSLSWRETE